MPIHAAVSTSAICPPSQSRGRINRTMLRRRSSMSMPVGISSMDAFLSPSNVGIAPHVGHLYTLILTDILKRWQALRGRKAILCTGTDEHGMKVRVEHQLMERCLMMHWSRYNRQPARQEWNRRLSATKTSNRSRFVDCLHRILILRD